METLHGALRSGLRFNRYDLFPFLDHIINFSIAAFCLALPEIQSLLPAAGGCFQQLESGKLLRVN